MFFFFFFCSLKKNYRANKKVEEYDEYRGREYSSMKCTWWNEAAEMEFLRRRFIARRRIVRLVGLWNSTTKLDFFVLWAVRDRTSRVLFDPSAWDIFISSVFEKEWFSQYAQRCKSIWRTFVTSALRGPNETIARLLTLSERMPP